MKCLDDLYLGVLGFFKTNILFFIFLKELGLLIFWMGLVVVKHLLNGKGFVKLKVLYMCFSLKYCI